MDAGKDSGGAAVGAPLKAAVLETRHATIEEVGSDPTFPTKSAIIFGLGVASRSLEFDTNCSASTS